MIRLLNDYGTWKDVMIFIGKKNKKKRIQMWHAAAEETHKRVFCDNQSAASNILFTQDTASEEKLIEMDCVMFSRWSLSGNVQRTAYTVYTRRVRKQQLQRFPRFYQLFELWKISFTITVINADAVEIRAASVSVILFGV